MQTHSDSDAHRPSTRRLSTSMARVLREFSRDFDRRVTRLLRDRGHPDISLSHQVVFSNLGLGRTRVTELAERAQITQQAMGKTLRELEALGYIERVADDTDRRAKAILLTQRGQQLVEDSVRSIEQVSQHYADKIGSEALRELDARLRDAANRLDFDYLPSKWAEAVGNEGDATGS